ncbi:MAG: ATP-binding protein [Terricaulis sp.]|nr:ATP-binding protein [Terricaulis sp.]
MKVQFVELAGFRGFRVRTRFDIPRGFVVLTGRNGTGKSTVLDAIDFVLTGTINKFAVTGARGGGLESHIWWVGNGVASEHYARIGFATDDGQELVLTRERDGKLDCAPQKVADILCGGAAHGEKWAETLMQTTLIRDETLSGLSLDLPEQARFAAVRAAIGGLTGPDHSVRTSAVLREANTARTEQEARLKSVEGDLGRALSALTEARSAADKQPDVAEAMRILNAIAPDLAGATDGVAEPLRAPDCRPQAIHPGPIRRHSPC